MKNNRLTRGIPSDLVDDLIEACVATHEHIEIDTNNERYDLFKEALAQDKAEVAAYSKPFPFRAPGPTQEAEHAAKIACALKKQMFLQPSYVDAIRFTPVGAAAEAYGPRSLQVQDEAVVVRMERIWTATKHAFNLISR